MNLLSSIGTAGAGTLILEFATLSRLTGDNRFEKAAYKSFFAVWNRRSDINLVGNTINVWNGVRSSRPTPTKKADGLRSRIGYTPKSALLEQE